MEPKTFTTCHLVKHEELNHHGTLFAGRAAEWFVESGFIAAASITKPEHIVCMRIHGMTFSKPIHLGDLVTFESKVVHTGKSRMVSYIHTYILGEEVLSGFITFVHVDKDSKPIPHGIVITPTKPEDIALQKEAMAL